MEMYKMVVYFFLVLLFNNSRNRKCRLSCKARGYRNVHKIYDATERKIIGNPRSHSPGTSENITLMFNVDYI